MTALGETPCSNEQVNSVLNALRIQTIPEPLDSYFVPVVINSGIPNLSQTLLSEKLLKHENPKNNATQMCASPLLTQAQKQAALYSIPSIYPLPSHRSTDQNFTLFEATPGRPLKFYFLANHIERTS